MKKMETKRCFIALDLPREAINEIKKTQNLIWKKTLFTGKITEPENLHLTLKFLGEINEDKINEIRKRLREIKPKSFEAELGEVGIFSKQFIKIIWVKLNGKGVFQLQKEIDNKLKDLFEPEQRFMGHITIARVKNVKDKEELIEYLENLKIKRIKFKVNEFILKNSELMPEGPVYLDIEKYALIDNNKKI